MPQRTGLEVFDAHSPMEKNILPWRKEKEKRMISFGGKSGQQQQNSRALCDLEGGGGGGACWDLGQAMMTRPMTNTFPVMQGTVPGLLRWVYESTVDAEVMNWKAN